jgi:hypothetical protein
MKTMRNRTIRRPAATATAAGESALRRAARRVAAAAASTLGAVAAAAWLGLAPASAPVPAGLPASSLLAAGVSTPAARADALTYSETRRQFKVGVLLLDSTADVNNDGVISAQEAAKGPENPDPYVFYIADARGDIKPQNWELVNPLAPATVTPDVFKRWSYQDGTDPALSGRDPGHPYKIGQKVSKDMAAYWEVSLSRASEQELLQYDLLFITNHRRWSMTAIEAEKLRRIVDAGAVVWIEDCGRMRIDPRGRFFLSDIQFYGSQAGLGLTGGDNPSGPVVYAPTHPILNSPFRMSFQEIANLGDKNYGDFYLRFLNDTATASGNPEDTTNTAPNKETLVNIVGNAFRTDVNLPGKALPYIAAGTYGSGAVAATASDSGCDINDYAGGFNVGSGGNSGAYCGPNIASAHTEDLKFVYNLISWGSGSNTARRNNRRTGASFAGANAPLVNNFDIPTAGVDPLVPSLGGVVGVSSVTSTIVRNGILYASGVDNTGNGVIVAYDAQPLRDFDGDGNPDDGRPDLLYGAPYDELWRVNVGGGPPSAPVFATLSLAGGAQRDVILVTGNDGTLYAADAVPVVGGRLDPSGAPALVGTNPRIATAAPYVGVGGSGTPPAPVFFENKVYVVEQTGRVRCVSGINLTTVWVSTDVSNLPNILPTGNPALAINRLNVRGTLADFSAGNTSDIMLYVPSEVTPAGGGNAIGRVSAYWLGTRNEVDKDIGNDGKARLRPAKGQDLNRYFVAKGVAGGQPWAITPRITIYADTLDGSGNVIATREQNYARGITAGPAFTYDLPLEDSGTNNNYFSGVIQLRYNGNIYNPNATPPVPKAMIAADYDVVYVPADGSAPPPLLSGTSGLTGARTVRVLDVPNYVPNPTAAPGAGTPVLPSLDTPAVAPDGLVVFAANQQSPNTVGGGALPNPLFGSVFAVSEQEFSANASRLRWRFALQPGTTGPVGDDGLRAIEVEGVPVVENPALRNRLVFDAPNDAAVVLPVRPFYEALRNAQVFGAPIVANNGLTYVLAQAYSARNDAVGAGPNTPNVSVLMALKTNPEIVLTLPEAFDATKAVTVVQADMLTYDAGSGTVGQTAQFTFQNTGDGVQVQADPARGKITLVNFQNNNGGGQQFSASQSFVVRYTPAGGAQEKRVVIPATPTILGDPNSATGDPNVTNQTTDPSGGNARSGANGFSPLQWYYVLPGRPLSSPTLNGDSLYFNIATPTAGGGFSPQVIALDADPAANDPTVRIGSGEQVFNVVESIQQIGAGAPTKTTINHVRWRQTIPSERAAPPVGAEGTLAVATANGVGVYQENATLIAESKRILEVDGDGAATWVVNSTLDNRTAGGASPIYDGTGGTLDPTAAGRALLDRKELNRPQSVRKIGGTDYLIADTGNNRIVRIDRAAKVQFECASVTDPYKLLDSGDPLTLNAPTDVFYYPIVQYDSATGQVIGREEHFLIADAGNNRLIEVANYYDRNNRISGVPVWNPTITTDVDATTPGIQARGERVVVWVTRTGTREGRPLRFQNVQRFVATDPATGRTGRPFLTAVIGNATAAGSGSSVAADFTGGSVVQLNYNPFLTPFFDQTGNAVYTWPTPTGTDTPRDTEPRDNGTVTFAIGDIWIREPGGPAEGRLKRITRPTFFERILLPLRTAPAAPLQIREVYLIADADGVYACTAETYGTAPNTRQVLGAIWKFDQRDYNRMNGVDAAGNVIDTPVSPARLNYAGAGAATLTAAQYNTLPKFTPSSIRRLPNGRFLITNSYVGPSPWFTNGQFYGETFEVIPNFATGGTQFLTTETAAGGTFLPGQFSAPRLFRLPNTTTSGTARNAQRMGSRDNTGVTEQPTSSDRL